MKIELSDAEISLIVSALLISYGVIGDKQMTAFAEELTERRERTKAEAAKVGMNWNGGDL